MRKSAKKLKQKVKKIKSLKTDDPFGDSRIIPVLVDGPFILDPEVARRALAIPFALRNKLDR